MSARNSLNLARRIALTTLASCLLPGTLMAQAADEATPVAEEAGAAIAPSEAPVKEAKRKETPAPAEKPPEPEKKPADDAETPEPEPMDPDDEAAAENLEAQSAAVAKPVSADPIQIFGWREYILIKGIEEKLQAKLDTGALTSSIHAEETELFERDGKKWVRFIVTDPTVKKPARTRIEAPLIRIARVKEPGGESTPREVVRLNLQIGERKLSGEFTLNNRSNMLAPVLIGRNMIKDLGWVDPGRTHLADQKIFR